MTIYYICEMMHFVSKPREDYGNNRGHIYHLIADILWTPDRRALVTHSRAAVAGHQLSRVLYDATIPWETLEYNLKYLILYSHPCDNNNYGFIGWIFGGEIMLECLFIKFRNSLIIP